MTAKRKNSTYDRPAQSEIASANEASLTLIKGRPRLNHLLRSRCRFAFVVFAILAMAVVIRSGISASRGYALVATQNQAQQLELENERLRVTVTQVAGILARRIVSWVTLDDKLEKGELYGLIRFGSCTELVMPENVEILVKKGDKVRGGESIIGKIRN